MTHTCMFLFACSFIHSKSIIFSYPNLQIKWLSFQQNNLPGISFNTASQCGLQHEVNTCTALQCSSIHLQYLATYAINYDYLCTTIFPQGINTKKHGIGHTQHREGAFKFVYVFSGTHS